MKIEREPCPLCDSESRQDCNNCNGIGEVDLPLLEGAIYQAYCKTCNYHGSSFILNEGRPKEEKDFDTSNAGVCPNCQITMTFNISWGVLD